MRTVAIFSAFTVVVSVFAACSSSTTSPTPTTATQGPLTGTYSADSLDGTSPFVTITFSDNSHYEYVAKKCLSVDTTEPGDDDAGTTATGDDDAGADPDPDLGDDPADQVADNGATPDFDADPTDNGCIHTGTYNYTQTTLTLTDDGATKSTDVTIADLASDGTEVEDPAVGLTSSTTTTQSLTVGETSTPDALTTGSSALFGHASVGQFSAGGTHMRRTGLATGSGVGSVCTVSDGTSGSCMTTSSCSAKSGYHSTPDFCPGASNIQCCTTTSSGGNAAGSSAGSTDGSLTTGSAVAAARQWVSVQMPYCQAVEGGREIDPSCYRVHGHTCDRPPSTRNAVWDRYRSDCSGMVSYAWTIKAPGVTTEGFVPSNARYIPMQDLQPGDALLRPGHHVVLFESWTNKSAGQAKVLSEPGCDSKGGPHAQEQSWSMGRAPGAGTSAHWSGATYYSIRKKGSTLTQ